jgi:ubiquinone/menaquinone biosynthesis C-methylase UbiE
MIKSKSDQEDKIIKTYQKEDIAKRFDAERNKYSFQRYKHKIESNLLKKVLKSIKKESVTILDVACGTGRMLPTIISSNKKINYFGLDSSNEMTSHLKDKVKKMDIDAKIKIGDATKIPFEDNSFDLSFTYHLTWHLPEETQIKIINEMIRVTKKEGYIIFDILNKNFLWDNCKKVLGKKNTEGIYKVRVKDIKKVLKGHNYEIEKLSDFPIKNSFFYSILNLINLFRKFLPINIFHMIYFRIKK